MVDIVAAFETALGQRSASAAAPTVRLVEAVMRGGGSMCHAADRLRWATALRGLAEDAGLTPELRARALEGTASLMRHSDHSASRVDLEFASAAWHEAGDAFGEFRALARATNAAALAGQHADAAALLARVRMLDNLSWQPGQRRWRWFAEGVVAVSAGDLPRAITAWRQQLALMQGWDDERAQALLSLANAEQITGDAAAALPRLLESIAIARRIHKRATLYSFLLPNLMAAHIALGDLVAAHAAATEGWPHARAQDAQAWWADHLALLAVREGRPRTAARLLGLADAGYERLKDARQALESQAAATAEAAVRATLGDAAFDALRAEGRTLVAADSVVADALASVDGAPAARAG
jgi:tetratricopeptide (TPR) repeat protein